MERNATFGLLVLLLAGGYGCSSTGGSSGASATGGESGTGAGGTGVGGTGGSGGVPLVPADKIDLLLMIDNSISMADKQQLLAGAVPQLVSRLITPVIDPVRGQPEFKAVQDIHVGVISSSLGGHGADQCSPSGPAANPTQYDNAHLIASVRPSASLESYQNLGFLWWDPTGQKGTAGPGEDSPETLVANVAAHVQATGENGCGFEAQLESWYRFLVDPAPPAKVVVVDGVAQVQGVDEVVLKQRADFLRPDSALIVMMLTDENDCSIVDGGPYWMVAQTSNPNNTAFHLPRATSACAVDPDDPCCRSCGQAETSPPAGCSTLALDTECKKGSWDDQDDHPMLRCWQQKRRFGASFLYPVERYVAALTQPEICPTWTATGPAPGCQLVQNPLLTARNAGLVFLSGIVGVPWQDLASDDTLSSPNELRYLTATELAAKGRWAWLLANDTKDEPDDPLMVESVEPRFGHQPSTGVALADPFANAGAHPANGHEWNTAGGDLQYACIFRLSTPEDCGVAFGGCDCDGVGTGYTANNPLCQDPATNAYSQLQRYAKAYPGTRHLEVLKGIGSQAVVVSICPKVTTGDPSSAHYGYNPSVDVLLKTLAPVLSK